MNIMILALLLCFAGVGCADNAKAPRTATAPKPIASRPSQKPVSSQPTPTASEAMQKPVYSYNPAGRRDPFAPIIVKEEKKARRGELPPLQRYNLYDFKLTGILWGGYGYKAMVEGPDGKGYFIRVGTTIGANKGIVRRITQNKVFVEEKFKNFSGKTERKQIVIELRKKQEGMQ